MFEPELQLNWRQRVAAYWAISWPALLFSLLAASFASSSATMDQQWAKLSLAAQILFFGAQALLVHRLLRKKFRTFRLEKINDNGEGSSSFSLTEGFEVWFWILWPQLVFVTILAVLSWWLASHSARYEARLLFGLNVEIRFLIVGPYAVGLAQRTKYHGFRIRAYSYRFI